jgi:hypothetical protein
MVLLVLLKLILKIKNLTVVQNTFKAPDTALILIMHKIYIFFFFLVVLFYLLWISRFSVEVGISFDHTERHTTVGRTPLDEGSSQRPLPDNNTQTLTRDKHPCPRWDSNPRS